jgi:hypothetical protein
MIINKESKNLKNSIDTYKPKRNKKISWTDVQHNQGLRDGIVHNFHGDDNQLRKPT